MKVGLVIDTNVVVSAQLKPDGNEALVLAQGLNPAGPFEWYASEVIMAEYSRVLEYGKLRLSKENIQRLLILIRHRVIVARPSAVIFECPHEPDNRFLECAAE